VLPAKEIRPLPAALTGALGRLLSELKMPRTLIDAELAQMESCVIAATSSRSVLGSMNELAFIAKLYLGELPPRSPSEIHRCLAEVPMKPLGYRYPREVAFDLLSATKE
jgi:hypothetical protein